MSIEIQYDVSLAPLTTWKIGGAAEYFCTPRDEQELVEAVAWAKERALPVQILGRGSNVLIADAGLKGLVICLRDMVEDEVNYDPLGQSGNLLEVPAGMSLPRLSKVVAQLGFGGYEFYIGIPGTVGAAVVINAGYGPGDERQTAALCSEVRTLSLKGDLQWHPYSKYNPVYRHTDLVESGLIVTSARFSLRDRAERDQIRKETAKHLAMRKNMQPLTRPTTGSVFKGTEDGTPAAVYIDRCGLKGTQVGGAVVSSKHANWIENAGDATAADVLELIARVKAVVLEKEGVRLEEEVRLMGEG